MCREENKAFSANGPGKIGKPDAKEWNGTLICHHVQKLFEMDQRPKYEIWNSKLHWRNIGTKLMDLGLREDFINLTQRQGK